MFLDRIIHFGETLGGQVKGRSPKKLELLIEVPYVVHVRVHVLSLNMILISTPYRVLTPSYPFRKDMGDQVKGRSPKKLESLIEVPNVVHVKVHVLSFNMILISSQ